MNWFAAPDYWFARLVFERGLAVIYVIAFTVAGRQFRGLLGSRGLLPIPGYLDGVSFLRKPSLFHLRYSDRLFALVAWSGAALGAAMAAGLGDALPLWGAMLGWLVLWALYLSIVNAGQLWYAFGWESLLLEAGFLAVFLGNSRSPPPVLLLWLLRWLLLRLEFGAGLIKLRGDRCWRDLTCLRYHHETQPLPGPLSWFFHHLPDPLHGAEVAGNYVAQLTAPVVLFAPQPAASVAAAVIVVTQLWLVASGNFAWLNWLTILIACSVTDTALVGRLLPVPAAPHLAPAPPWYEALVIAYAAAVVLLSYRPARNLVSRRQLMNAGFDPFHLVNTYGAFGRISRQRYELVIEGTADPATGPRGCHLATPSRGCRVCSTGCSRATLTCSGCCGSTRSPARRRPGSGSAATATSSPAGGSCAGPAPGGNGPPRASSLSRLRRMPGPGCSPVKRTANAGARPVEPRGRGR